MNNNDDGSKEFFESMDRVDRKIETLAIMVLLGGVALGGIALLVLSWIDRMPK